MLDLLANAVLAGLLLGGFYAAVTIGLSIAFGFLDIVNIAHPGFVLIGAFTAWLLNASWGIDPILAGLFLSEVALILLFGVDYRSVSLPYLETMIGIGPVAVPLRLVVPFAVSLVMFAVLQVAFDRSFLGRAIKAVAQDPI